MPHASHFSPRIACTGTAGFAAPGRLLQAVLWVERAFRTARERRQLMGLDDRGLKDIGLSRADAHREWSRPFWDLPRDR
jgi:uncharacterized protein YjiS (DUF1127 family)